MIDRTAGLACSESFLPIAHSFPQKPSENTLASLLERDESPQAVQPTIDTVVASPVPPPHASSPQAPSQSMASVLKTPQTTSRTIPSFGEMHPGKVHPSTTSKIEASMVNRAMDLGVNTPLSASKQTISGTLQQTPTKVRGSLPSHVSSPGFDFSFAGSESSLSNETQTIMNNVRREAARIKAQLDTGSEGRDAQSENTSQVSAVAGRRIATPKGRSGRYSDAHKAEFRKMDSITDHPSAWKSKIQTTTTSLKRSNSNANLDESQIPRKTTKSVSMKSPNMYDDLGDLRERTHAKRVKQNREDDAPNAPAPQSLMHSPSKSHIPTRLPSAITTPTKASLARSSSTKHLNASKIPGLPRTQSSYTLGSPTAPRTEGRNRYLSSLAKITPLKSILQRRENKLAEVSASLSSRAGEHEGHSTSQIPQRTPTTKRVNFTSSTKDRHTLEEVPSQPATPTNQTTSISYPTLPSIDSPNVTHRPIKALRPPSSAPAKPSSRSSTAFTFTGDNASLNPHQPSFGFGYASPRPGAPKTPMTIRTVRPSGITGPTNLSFSGLANGNSLEMPGAFPVIRHGMSNKKRRRSEASDLSSDEYASADEAPGDKGKNKENLDPSAFSTPPKLKSPAPASSEHSKPAQYITRGTPHALSSPGGHGGPSPAKKARTGPSLYRQGEKEEKDAKKAETPATRRLQKKQAAKAAIVTTPGKKVGGMSLSRLSALAKPKERR